MLLPGKEETRELQGGKPWQTTLGMLLLLWFTFGLQQDAHTLGCGQRRGGVPKIPWEGGETFFGPQIGKRICNVPVCLFAGFLIEVFQGEAQLCLLQRGCQGQQHLSWALGKRGCSVPTAGMVCVAALYARLC